MAGNKDILAPPGRRAAKPPRYQYSFSSEISMRAGSTAFYSRRETFIPVVYGWVTLQDLIEILLLGNYLCVAAVVPSCAGFHPVFAFGRRMINPILIAIGKPLRPN